MRIAAAASVTLGVGAITYGIGHTVAAERHRPAVDTRLAIASEQYRRDSRRTGLGGLAGEPDCEADPALTLVPDWFGSGSIGLCCIAGEAATELAGGGDVRSAEGALEASYSPHFRTTNTRGP